MHRHADAAETDGMLIRWARGYDLLLKIMTLGQEGHIRRRVTRAAGLEAGDRVLDVGCGTGTLALAAVEAVGPAGRVHGIDPAPEMIARAKAKAKKAGAAIELEVGVIEALPLADQSIDVVLSTLMFHHLPGDDLQRAGLAEIRRVLAPGGRLLIVDFGKPDELVAKAEAAGFAAITTGRLGPRLLFTMHAKQDALPT